MVENKDIVPILKGVAQFQELLKEIYGDIAKPGVTQVGKALSTVVGLGNTILWPVNLLNERAKIALEKNLENYREQIKDVPLEQISEVPPELGVPIAEKLGYVTDEQISDLYINLLAKASTTKYSHTAHPSFVNVINNLSPDEALLLPHIHSNFPFVEARLQKKNTHEWSTIGQLLTGLEKVVRLLFPQNIVAYFSNFEGLGLINIRHDLIVANLTVYEALEKQYRSTIKLAIDETVHELVFHRGTIDITPFGKLFISACLKKLKQ